MVTGALQGGAHTKELGQHAPGLGVSETGHLTVATVAGNVGMATVGNIVGRAFIGLVYWWVYRRDAETE